MWDDNTSEVFISYLMEDTGRPITGLDFASLYPHLIMTYNLTPEYIISKKTCDDSTEKMVRKAKKAYKNEHTLHKIMFPYGDRTITGYSIRHDNKPELFGVYPTLLKELYDKRSVLKKPKIYYEMLVEHVEKLNDDIVHNNRIVDFLSKNNVEFNNETDWEPLIQIEPSFSYGKEIYNFHNNCEESNETLKFVKKSSIEHIAVDSAIVFICEELKIENTSENKKKIAEILNHESDKLTLDDLEFYFAYYDSKQKALKIMMSTLYGESGNKISPFYILALAGGITSAGKYNLEFVKNICLELECGVKYGDTDSVYITVPEYSFKKIDNQYYGGGISKLEYCNGLINNTIFEIKKINKIINNRLAKDNGTTFLRLNYEEVLFPVVLLSKKKYYGKPHISVPNFSSNKKPFIRGLEIKKRGTSAVLKKVFEKKILTESLSIYNKKELMELVYDAVHYFYENKWKIEDFIRTAIYKPKTIQEVLEGKGNKSVLEFAGRMHNRGEYIKPYERFKYIIAKKYPIAYDYRGRKRELRVGERMELLEHVKRFDMEIDRDYYMKANIITQLARVLSYRSEFYVSSIDDSVGEIKKANEKMVKKSTKHITEFINEKRFCNVYSDVGFIKKLIFKKAETIIINKFVQITKIEKKYVDYIFKDWKLDSVKAFKNIEDSVNKNSIKKMANYGKEFIDFTFNSEKHKSKNLRKNKKKLILKLRELYDANSENMNLYSEFKNKNIISVDNKFREMFKSIITIITEYRDSLSMISYVVEKKLQPILDLFYKPINDKLSLIKKYEKMSIDEMIILINLSVSDDSSSDNQVHIPYHFLNEVAEDAVYNLMKNSNIICVIKNLMGIERELQSILNIFNQTISIQNALEIYTDKKNNMLLTIYDKPEIIKNHKDDIIKETCHFLENIDFDV